MLGYRILSKKDNGINKLTLELGRKNFGRGRIAECIQEEVKINLYGGDSNVI